MADLGALKGHGTVARRVGPAGLDLASPGAAGQRCLRERAASSGGLPAARVSLVRSRHGTSV